MSTTKKHSQIRNRIYPPIRANIAGDKNISSGGDLAENINPRQFKADIPKSTRKELNHLIKSGDIKTAYEKACDYVVDYFLDDDRTYDFKQYDHSYWVELLLDLVSK